MSSKIDEGKIVKKLKTLFLDFNDSWVEINEKIFKEKNRAHD